VISNNVIGPINYVITNAALGTDITLYNNTQPDGTPVLGLDWFTQ
jgi:hypothetical protein